MCWWATLEPGVGGGPPDESFLDLELLQRGQQEFKRHPMYAGLV